MVATAGMADADDPALLQKLSKELLVAKTVYEHAKSNPLSFDELVAELTRYATRQMVSRAVDSLFDKGVLKAEWRKRETGHSVRVLEIAGEAQDFVQLISRNYRSVLSG